VSHGFIYVTAQIHLSDIHIVLPEIDYIHRAECSNGS